MTLGGSELSRRAEKVVKQHASYFMIRTPQSVLTPSNGLVAAVII
jgi:hypothetical protein